MSVPDLWPQTENMTLDREGSPIMPVALSLRLEHEYASRRRNLTHRLEYTIIYWRTHVAIDNTTRRV
jgi:hypothetical protein